MSGRATISKHGLREQVGALMGEIEEFVGHGDKMGGTATNLALLGARLLWKAR